MTPHMYRKMESFEAMQSEQLFEAALGVDAPWYVKESCFDAEAKTLTICVDFRAGSRFSHPEVAGEHPVHDTQAKRYRHLNSFQHECFLTVRVPRVKLPDGSFRKVLTTRGDGRIRVKVKDGKWDVSTSRIANQPNTTSSN